MVFGLRGEVGMGRVEDSLEWLGMGDVRFLYVWDRAIVKRMKRTDELACGNCAMPERVKGG